MENDHVVIVGPEGFIQKVYELFSKTVS